MTHARTRAYLLALLWKVHAQREKGAIGGEREREREREGGREGGREMGGGGETLMLESGRRVRPGGGGNKERTSLTCKHKSASGTNGKMAGRAKRQQTRRREGIWGGGQGRGVYCVFLLCCVVLSTTGFSAVSIASRVLEHSASTEGL